MGIVQPDPGIAMEMAKKFTYDESKKCFKRGEGEFRYLVPCGTLSARLYQATVLPERTFSRSTYDLLRAGAPSPNHPSYVFESPPLSGKFYTLEDEDFEVVAREY